MQVKIARTERHLLAHVLDRIKPIATITFLDEGLAARRPTVHDVAEVLDAIGSISPRYNLYKVRSATSVSLEHVQLNNGTDRKTVALSHRSFRRLLSRCLQERWRGRRPHGLGRTPQVRLEIYLERLPVREANFCPHARAAKVLYGVLLRVYGPGGCPAIQQEQAICSCGLRLVTICS